MKKSLVVVSLIFSAQFTHAAEVKPGLWEITNQMQGAAGSKMDAAMVQMQKQMAELGVTGEAHVQFLMKKGGLIDFSKSNLNADPTPEQFVVLPRQNGDTLKARTTWFKDHIEFYRFEQD